MANYEVLSHAAIVYLTGLIRDLASVSEGVDDLHLASNSTFSSVKIDTLIKQCLQDSNEYTDRLVANLSRLELKIATSESEITQPNIMYLYKPSGATSYEQYVVIEGTKVLLGTCDINMGDYYTISQADAKFCLITDYETLRDKVTAIEDEIGTETLTTTSATITGAINEVKTSVPTDDDIKSLADGQINSKKQILGFNDLKGITADSTLDDVVKAVPNGKIAILQSANFTNYLGLPHQMYTITINSLGYNRNQIIATAKYSDNPSISFIGGCNNSSGTDIYDQWIKMSTTNDIATSISNTPSDDKVVSEKAVDTAIKNIAFPNPNLLDNPWFTVNQRGQTSYTGSGYGIDRWKSYSSANTVEVNSDGSITVTNTSDKRTYFGQPVDIEYIKKLKGKTVTLSIDGFCSSGTYLYLHIKNGSVGENISDTVKNKIGTTRAIYSMTITVPDKDFDFCEWFDFSINAGESLTIYSAKIELGSASTLHLDSAPNYATELAKCQRYYQRIKIPVNAVVGYGCTRSVSTDTKTAQHRIFIPILQPMAKTPKFGFDNLKLCDYSTGEDIVTDSTLTSADAYKVTNAALQSYTDAMVQLRVNSTDRDSRGNAITMGDTVVLSSPDSTEWGGYIELSADF